ncbi:biotin synthase BioB [Succinimonas amylolytica]|uniref:biotin synthase BioB n=1 Tax=Succinimonas amylolytica TaxID=83769 RepID=UPI0003776D5D|nr:biotin synthase BioB [Succinimonas amylolytica]
MNEIRHNWTQREVKEILTSPFLELVMRANQVHREYFPGGTVQISSLLSIKTGNCPEDCKYCPQSIHNHTGLRSEKLLDKNTVLEKAKKARDAGATRFCMGAAWRDPRDRDMSYIVEIIRMVKSLGLETCMTLGMLTENQARELKNAGLDYYNHNLDTSPEYYREIITTRTYEERLKTLEIVRRAGIKICSGGIIGMGESNDDRASFLRTLANLNPHPESVPINILVKVPGLPLEHQPDVDPLEFVRMIATARIIMPASYVRMSAGRKSLSAEAQALAFLAGANSVFYGCRLLTTPNAEEDTDLLLLKKLGVKTTLTGPQSTPEEDHQKICDSIHDIISDHSCYSLEKNL